MTSIVRIGLCDSCKKRNRLNTVVFPGCKHQPTEHFTVCDDCLDDDPGCLHCAKELHPINAK